MAVRFGDVHIREHTAHIRQDSAGNYKMGLDWTVRADFVRQIDSWEAERERTRISKSRHDDLHAKGQSIIKASLAAPSSPVRTEMKASPAPAPTVAPYPTTPGAVGGGFAKKATPPGTAVAPGKGAFGTTPAKPPAGARIVEHWHVKQDGRIYQGPGEHSSPVASTDGRLITTTSGSQYWLGELDPRIRAVLDMTDAPFDPEDPLDNAAALLYAERIVYGKAAATISALDDILVTLSSDLEVKSLTGHHFSVLADVLRQMGIQTPKLATAQAAGGAGASSAFAAGLPHGLGAGIGAGSAGAKGGAGVMPGGRR